jgi:hypothetical protein
LELTSDLFDVLLSFLCGTKSNFLDFPGEVTPTPRDKTAKLAKSPETTVQKNGLRGCKPQAVSFPQLLREASGVQPHKTVQKNCTNEGISPDADGVNYAQPLKVTEAERF